MVALNHEAALTTTVLQMINATDMCCGPGLGHPDADAQPGGGDRFAWPRAAPCDWIAARIARPRLQVCHDALDTEALGSVMEQLAGSMAGLHVAALCVLVGDPADSKGGVGGGAGGGAGGGVGGGGGGGAGTLDAEIVTWLLQHGGNRLWKLPAETLEQLAAHSADFHEVHSFNMDGGM